MTSPDQVDLTIVIPAYREERRIGATLEALATYLKQNESLMQVEVLVVAADTDDRTKDIVREERRQFKNLALLEPGGHVGKGRDVQYGMLRAQGNVVLYMDADLATPLHHINQAYKACLRDDGIVIGTRNLSRYRDSTMRNLFARFGNMLYRHTGGVAVEDTQCGFKVFSRRAAQLCFTRLTILGWGFDQEVLAIAKVNNILIRPVRIDDWIDKPYSTYTDGVLRVATRSIHDFARIRCNVIRGTYVKQTPKLPIH